MKKIILSRALNKILAEDVVAPQNVPAENNSAVDGYAIFFDDLNESGKTKLPVVGKVTLVDRLTVNKKGERQLEFSREQ